MVKHPPLHLIASAPCVSKQRGRAWRGFEDAFREAGLGYEMHVTDSPGHATLLASSLASLHPESVLAAVGGDGTLGEVVQGLMQVEPERRPSLAVIPLGRGNDFFRSLPLAMTPAGVLAALRGSKRLDLDLGQAELCDAQTGSKVQRHFVNLGSIGFAADVSASVARYGRSVGGTWPYVRGLLENLVTWRNRPVEIEIDGHKLRCVMFTINVANGRFYGGGMQAAPGARLDDGLLDVTIMRDLSVLDVLRYMPNNYSGRFEGIPQISMQRGHTIRISSPEPQLVQLDGDVVGTTPVTFCVVPGALRLCI